MTHDLSRLQFVVATLVQDSGLLTRADLTHLHHCEITIAPSTYGENALVADVAMFFESWSYLDQKEDRSGIHSTPAEIRMVFDWDIERKLTGKVQVGFFGEDPVLFRQLDYIRGR